MESTFSGGYEYLQLEESGGHGYSRQEKGVWVTAYVVVVWIMREDCTIGTLCERR